MSKQYLPAPWGAPVPYKGVNGGAIWHGSEPATQKDIDELKTLAYRVLIDDRTLCGKRLPDGRKNPDWTTYYDEMSAAEAKWNPWLSFRRWASRR